nr:MAG TPA: hypothetical protein [Caudoviricetes sp.]
MTEGGLVRDCVKGLGEIVTLCQVVCHMRNSNRYD